MTLGEKIDRALDIADLSITELSEAIDVQRGAERCNTCLGETGRPGQTKEVEEMRLIDADTLLLKLQKDPLFPLVEQYGISRVIEVATTIEAEPIRHGHWTDDCRCSECGAEAITEWNETGGAWIMTPYCPWCGAKMDDEYKGCQNCKYQIEPLRACEWIERGGDGRLHFICPRWEKKR